MDSLTVTQSAWEHGPLWGIIATIIVMGSGVAIAIVRSGKDMVKNGKDFIIALFERDDKRHAQFIEREEKIKEEMRVNHREIMDRVGGIEKDWMRDRGDFDRRLSRVENEIQNISNNGRERDYPK